MGLKKYFEELVVDKFVSDEVVSDEVVVNGSLEADELISSDRYLTEGRGEGYAGIPIAKRVSASEQIRITFTVDGPTMVFVDLTLDGAEGIGEDRVVALKKQLIEAVNETSFIGGNTSIENTDVVYPDGFEDDISLEHTGTDYEFDLIIQNNEPHNIGRNFRICPYVKITTATAKDVNLDILDAVVEDK